MDFGIFGQVLSDNVTTFFQDTNWLNVSIIYMVANIISVKFIARKFVQGVVAVFPDSIEDAILDFFGKFGSALVQAIADERKRKAERKAKKSKPMP